MSPMNNRRMVPTREPGILDFAPGAAAAYSLRNLSLSYSGPVVTVRRSTDDAEADFTATEVSDGTLAAWCSGGNGFVKTWHDQSGEENSVSQTTSSDQPQIVDSGSLVTEGGKAAILFDGTDDYLSRSFSISTLNVTTFFVYRSLGTDGNRRIYELGSPTGFPNSLYAAEGFASGGKQAGYRYPENLPVNGPAADTRMTVGFYVRNSTTSQAAAYNGVLYSQAGTTTTFISDELKIGISGTFTVNCFDGTISELLIYPRDMTAERQLIEGNLAWTYNA